MHCFNQGFFTIREHTLLLTKDNLLKCDKYFRDCTHFGSSAMHNSITFGVPRGRPFDGTYDVDKMNLQSLITNNACSERLALSE